MLQKKEYQQQQRYQQHLQNTNATKEGVPATPTKTNATKEGVPTATKLPVAPTKTNATKEGYQYSNKVTSNTYKN